jgi:lysophospholipase L1-like esterase
MRKLLPLTLISVSLYAQGVGAQEAIDVAILKKPALRGYVEFAGAACQATISGRGITVTNTRNSVAWVTLGGVESQCSALQSRIGDLGMLVEGATTQYVTSPTSVSGVQTVTLAPGLTYGHMTGSGSAALAVGTATATNLPFTINATTPRSFTVSTPGTVTATPSGTVSLLQITTGFGGPSSPIYSAMTRAADVPSFPVDPKYSNDYCIYTNAWQAGNGSVLNMPGTTGILGVGATGADRMHATMASYNLLTGTFADSANATKVLTAKLASAEYATAHSLALCRCPDGRVSMYLDGVSVGTDSGAGTGIATTTPPATGYLGYAGGSKGPIWIRDVGMNKGCTKPGVTLETRTRVAAIGDSITLGTGYTPYPTALLGLLGSGYLMTTSAGAGYNTTQILANYTGAQVQDRRFNVLLVLGGINDVRAGTAAATTEANLQAIYDGQRAQGGRLMIATMLPWKACAFYTDPYELVRQEINAWIRAYGAANGVPVVDFSATFDNGTGQMRAEWDSGDHLHPNTAGYAEMAAQFRAAGQAAGLW